MTLAGVIIETPALEEVGLPIPVTEYDIQRELNSAGSFAVSFPATQTLARQVRSRWRVSIIEEGREGYLLRRGVVISRNYRVNADGTGILTLAGYTRLYTLTANSTHQNLVYDGSQSFEDIANDLTGETVTAPADASTIFPKVTFSETSKLQALLKIAEMARYNLRETFDEDGFELTPWDDVPDSGYRFVTVEHAGPELENAAANGMGLIAGTPTIGYDGKDLATRIIPIGVEFDGTPLELNSSDGSTPYTIQTGTNPDATSFYYIEDSDATDAVGLIEMQYHRQDVKNPSDNAGTRLAAANALYKLAVGELQKRKSDVIAFASEIANARHIDALPGERVRIQFRGRARAPSGYLVWQDIDQDFLIAKRRDASGSAGVRGVSFTLTAPETILSDPELPDAIPIPPAPRDPPDPPYPNTDDNFNDTGGDDTGGGGEGDGSDLGLDAPAFEDPGAPDAGAIADLPPMDPNGPNPYQQCCAPPTEINSIPTGTPWTSPTTDGGTPDALGDGSLSPTAAYLMASLGTPAGSDVTIIEVVAPTPQTVVIAGGAPQEVNVGFWLAVPNGPTPTLDTGTFAGYVRIEDVDLTNPLIDIDPGPGDFGIGDTNVLNGNPGGSVQVTPMGENSLCVAMAIRVGDLAFDATPDRVSDMAFVPAAGFGFGTQMPVPGFKAQSGSFEFSYSDATGTYHCGLWAGAVALRHA